jgi:alanine-synthesizing transaminase
MDFRRIGTLPPYVFAEIDRLKLELRRSGKDVIDLGFGNPDLPSPPVAVEKLCEAALRPERNARASAHWRCAPLRHYANRSASM